MQTNKYLASEPEHRCVAEDSVSFLRFLPLGLTLALGLASLPSCDTPPDRDDNADVIASIFANQSQFTVEQLFIHSAVDNYLGGVNRLEAPLAPGSTKDFNVPQQDWYVTVYRKPNQDSAVLAYTTAYAWNPGEYPKLIYFDEQFRAEKR